MNSISIKFFQNFLIKKIKKVIRIPKALFHRANILYEKIQGLDFTKHHMVDELGFSGDTAKAYAPSPETDLNIVLRQLDIQSTDAILDLGSGKGAAMVTMSRFDFNLIDGVELSEFLIEICKKNFSKLELDEMEIFHSDAREFKHLDRYTHFYLFNPFPENVLLEVLQNIQKSEKKIPRKITLIYNCPRHQDVINNHQFFTEAKTFKGKNWDTIVFSNRK